MFHKICKKERRDLFKNVEILHDLFVILHIPFSYSLRLFYYFFVKN